MITQFAEWSANIAETAALSTLSGSSIGIEAAEYLNRIQDFKLPPSQTAGVQPEPLLPALGGVPFGLARVVRIHLEIWRRHGIKPVFVFSGLNLIKDDFEPSEQAARKLEEAWRFYDANNALAAVETFKTSGAVKAHDLYRFLQTILREENIAWMVAPYMASAQLYYLAKVGATDTTFASSEIFLFDIEENITTWNFENDSFVWVRRRNCLQSLGNISSDAFVDACLLAGCDLCPSLPQLDLPIHRKQPRLKSAADLVMNLGRGTGNGVYLHFQDDVTNKMQEQTDRFRKAKVTVKHSVVLTMSGKAEPLDVTNAPGKIHEFIGQRLPDELYGYFSRGIIGPRVLNWRTSGEFLMHPPLDGGESKEYRDLVRQQLTPIQTLTIGLLASPLHHYYQRTDIIKRVWFDKDHPEKIVMKTDYDNDKTKGLIDSWNVPQSVFGEEFNRHPNSSLFGLCVKSLKNNEFAARTKTFKNKNRLLISKDELLANAIWRMLRLRNYIDADHNLTSSGEMLYTMVSNLPLELQESALIATELLQYNRLNADITVPYTGVPDAQAESVKKQMLLISRIACLGPLKHQEIGYTGVLSRTMLSFGCVIEAVRQSLRDLLEVCLTTMLLNGDVERDRPDFNELGLDLPLLLPMSCSLGVAVAYHLTECAKLDMRSQANREALLNDEKSKFCYTIDLPSSFETAWTLWDAVYKGVEAGDANKLGAVKAAFKNADEWLKTYR
ncbi:uncharacterized protein PV09_05102 [Verruconis gallopava]|uniref:XPG N-terminal domain-containing protein n=1 Tax=Verruconis gallopava TaxID=253628 RepID=A0A0D1XMM7_9PEZI|nr:uncharacterized protein PV09_05102 [Verruconis gallopava]KIW03801.1 hypothetical protein PV09_05102 [Verruconis gallopava]